MYKIIIPAFNEQKNIENTIRTIESVLKPYRHRIYVVNDGSNDRTRQIIFRLAKRYIDLILINHPTNLGVSWAFKSGLMAAMEDSPNKRDVLVIMEADGTSDVGILLKMIKCVQRGSDVVIASRYLNGGKYQRFPVKRLVFSKSANFLLKRLFAMKNVTDFTIFYRAYSYGVIYSLINKCGDNFLKTKYFTANAELLFRLTPYVHRVSEVPLVYNYGKKKGKSGMKVGKNLWQYLKLMGIIIQFNLFHNKT